jgi:putative FmdB family regulatory protein
MPIYDYDCAACGRRFEVIHGVHADGPSVCELCGGGPVRKAVTAAAVHYRGSGWAKKERRSAGGSKAASETSSPDGGASDGTSSDGGGADRAGSDRASDDGAAAGGDKPARDGDASKKRSDTPGGASDPPRKSAADVPAPSSTKSD